MPGDDHRGHPATGPAGHLASIEADWEAARERAVTRKRRTMAVAALAMPAAAIPAATLAAHTVAGPARWLALWGWAFVLLAPCSYLVLHISLSEQRSTDTMVAGLTRELAGALDAAEQESSSRAAQVRRQELERRLAGAMDMADGEAEVVGVIERALRRTLPDAPAELLLADHSHAHLLRVASSAPAGVEPPGCGVESPDRCPAARRAQAQIFPDSEAIDACPKLRGRPGGPCSAVCVPVPVMGRTVGVLHATGDVGAPPGDAAAADLADLAKAAGARIGLLRVMAESELQASTDPLTGLLNRRAFEHRAALLRSRSDTAAVVMGDLDRFKALNDTYGHETGDRALRLFARLLGESVRAQDVIGRHGGEEFAAVLGGCDAAKAAEVLDGLRARMDAAATVAGLPSFTASFGVVDATGPEDLVSALARADAALLAAKRAGRDRVVVGGPGPLSQPAPTSAAGATARG